MRACLDVSHAAVLGAASGVDFLAEIQALGRVAKHVHVHDSFGDPTRIRTYARSETVAYGLGDPHFSIGWGNLPWHDVMAKAEFEPGVIFNLELPAPYWFALPDSVKAVRRMAEIYASRHANA